MSKISFIALLGLLSLSSFIEAADVCYGAHGCFTTAPPFSGTTARPVALLPQSPEKISAKYTLFSQKTTSGVVITANSISNLYNPLLGTKFIVHGFVDFGEKPWIVQMRQALLRVENVNVIVVDWSKGNGMPYTQATANTQVVGADIALVVNALAALGGNKANMHCIGHSLGAHTCGYAGKRLAGKLGRISGLDPAGLYFENTDVRVRLAPSDAVFVDSIHTDGVATLLAGLGMIQAVSHVDFYPNGGIDQPNCPATSLKLLSAIFNAVTLDVGGMTDNLACSHMSSVYYYTDSIEKKQDYVGYKCNSKDEFDKGKCIACSTRGCNQMGYWASPNKDIGKVFLNTDYSNKHDIPYSKQFYRVTLYSDSNSGPVQGRGNVDIYFKTKQFTSSKEWLDKGEVTFKVNSVETRLIGLSRPIRDGSIIEAVISYTKYNNVISGWMYDLDWKFAKVEIFNGELQTLFRLCVDSKLSEGFSTYKYKPC